MNTNKNQMTVLLVDDDPDDRFLIQEAVSEAGLQIMLEQAQDGQELIDYLCHQGKYTNGRAGPRPDLILLDLNMPRKDGREALAEIKANEKLQMIPIVVLTTSSSPDDIRQAYCLGVSSYLTKPVSFDGLVEMMKVLGEYWFNIAQLPKH
jgi:CheY-like chemotaxis protein